MDIFNAIADTVRPTLKYHSCGDRTKCNICDWIFTGAHKEVIFDRGSYLDHEFVCFECFDDEDYQDILRRDRPTIKTINHVDND